MGPAEADAPAAVLDALTPTDNEDALEWRRRCRANLAHRAAVRQRLRGVTDGVVIRTAVLLPFENGLQARLFRCVHRAGRTIRWQGITDDGDRFPCRLGSRWPERYSWEIVAPDTADSRAATPLAPEPVTPHRVDEGREGGGAA